MIKEESESFRLLRINTRQFFRLIRRYPTVTNADLAHRMDISEAEAKRLRNRLGKGKTKLIKLGVDYQTRVLLGKAGIVTLGDVLDVEPTELLEMPGFGPKTLEKLNRAISTFMGGQND